ncbi:MAG TPA: A24 family peptidase [Burkholderiaceae bacterium]|nr:A24 family peptidase [Burkholderiaceae bacterium]
MEGMAAMSPEQFFVLGAALIGLTVGSFLNVVIHRLPRMMEAAWRAQCDELAAKHAQLEQAPRYDLILPASHCPQCKTPLRALDNIPVLSWLLLRGKCRHCGVAISPRYPIVEALTGVLSAWVAWHFGWGVAGVAAIVLVWALIALCFIDADTTLLPDDITLPLLWIGLLINVGGVFVPLREAVLGAAAGYLFLWLVYWLFKIATGKEGMGYGDFKLLAALGAWLGWKMLLPIILISSVVGAVVGLVLMLLAGRGKDIPIPFGPYLTAAGLIALLYGEPIAGLLAIG